MRRCLGRAATLMAWAIFVPGVTGGELDAPISRLDLREWVGDWFADEERSLTIALVKGEGLHIDGLMTLGLLDPARVAAGTIEETGFSVIVSLDQVTINNMIDIVLRPEGPQVSGAADADDCVLTLELDWNVNWIDVMRTPGCSGLDAHYKGRYEYRPLRD